MSATDEENPTLTIRCKDEPSAVVVNLLVMLADNGKLGIDSFKSYKRDGSDFSFQLRKSVTDTFLED